MTTRNLIDSLVPQIMKMAKDFQGRNYKHWSMVSAKQGTTPTVGSWLMASRDAMSRETDRYLQNRAMIEGWLTWLFTGCLRKDWKIEGLYRYCCLRATELAFQDMMRWHTVEVQDSGKLEEMSSVTLDGARFVGLTPNSTVDSNPDP